MSSISGSSEKPAGGLIAHRSVKIWVKTRRTWHDRSAFGGSAHAERATAWIAADDRRRQRRFVDTKAPVRLFGSKSTPPADPICGQLHRTDVELGIGREARDAHATRPSHVSRSTIGLKPEFDRGVIDAGRNGIEVGSGTTSKARAPSKRSNRAKAMGAWVHDRHSALSATGFEECPCLRMADGLAVGNHDGRHFGRLHNNN